MGNGNTTELGKYLKKLRIDTGETLGDMSSNLDVSGAFLSSVETGKRKMPRTMVVKLCEKYDLSGGQKKSFYKAVGETNDRIEIPLAADDEKRNDVAISIAASILDLSQTQLEAISFIISNADLNKEQLEEFKQICAKKKERAYDN